jgi:hypothetical protein
MKKEHVLYLLLVMVALGAAGMSRTAYASNGDDNRSRFIAELSGDQVVPAVSTWAQGVAQFTLARHGKALKFRLYAETISAVMVAQIQCGPAGVNGPVVADLYNGPAINPQGQFAQGLITSVVITPRPASPACPGGIANMSDLLARLRSGDAYVNVRSMTHAQGEIRGQILTFDNIEY